jgi:hypothetical protein
VGQAKRKGTFEDRVALAKAKAEEDKKNAEEQRIARFVQECKAQDMMTDTQFDQSEERYMARQRRRNRVNATTAMLAAAYASVLPGPRW